MKPGVKTTEFWTAIAPLAALIAKACGLTPSTDGVVEGALLTAGLTIVSAWIGGGYLAGRLQLKQQPDVKQAIIDAAIASVRDVIVGEVDRRVGGLDPERTTDANPPPTQATP